MTREPTIPLGSYRLLLWWRSLTLPLSELCCHTHVLGKTSSGKSYFLTGGGPLTRTDHTGPGRTRPHPAHTASVP